MIPRNNDPLLIAMLLLLLFAVGCQVEQTPEAAPLTQPPPDSAGTTIPSPTTATDTPQPTETLPATSTSEPTSTATPTLIPTATIDPLTPSVVTIEGVDRVTATGTFFPGSGPAPWSGVILLHMSGDNRHVWEKNGFAHLLVENGFAVLAIDIRNHGDSGGDPSWDNGEADVRRWWNYFSSRDDIDAKHTALVGGSIGANLALFTGMQKSDVRTVVLLSAGLAYNNANVEGAMVEYGERPIFIVASEDDHRPAQDALVLADLAQGEAETLIYADAGHGTDMLTAKPELAGLILDWLDRRLK